MHLVCCCGHPVWGRSFWKKATLRDLCLPAMGPHFGGSCRKNNNTYTEPWALHVYQVSSKSIKRFWSRSRKCEQFTLDDRRTDGRRTTRYNNSSLEPSAQVSLKHQHLFPHPWLYLVFRSMQRKITLLEPLSPSLGPSLSRTGRRTTLIQNHEYFISTKFCQIPPSGSEDGVKNVKKKSTDDGWSVMTNLKLTWAS